ncbi:MAG: sodium-translocating pyrophosphatase [Heliobacteriaceae bacterium]|jgi:K(+)-stimulated pyrophosphate-energized sodium pump|nr:sodium-translocating pyrophosphatase [Heliobacteriaceae bacterium]
MLKKFFAALFTTLLAAVPALAGEADLVVPSIKDANPANYHLLIWGIAISVIGVIFGFIEFLKIKKLEVHSSMSQIGNTIFETCKTYLIQQGKFLLVLEVLIGLCIAFYFGCLQHAGLKGVLTILAWSVIGILGSYGVAWFGIRMNTLANSRTAFAALKGNPLNIMSIPLKAGMSIGVLLVSVELIMMLTILLFVPGHLAGACFIGFAIGESLGASALRVAGGIFTKIADIGSDLMKIQFGIKEDDPRNPGVIADCTGDNAGDSVGPTADGFETYGVTGVALVSFILLGVFPEFQVQLLTWIFTMRFLMIVTSVAAYWVNGLVDKFYAAKAEKFDFEQPLTNLVWLTSILSIIMTFSVSYKLLAPVGGNLWLVLSSIISCGTLGAALIPEFTKIFTSPKAKHTEEVVTASREGGASLTILSGLVAGNFSGFWIGMVIIALMGIAYFASTLIPPSAMIYPSVFAFGLVAFGFLGMGPVTIAVDSYGPVTDNAQSVYELSLIEEVPNVSEEIQKEFGFRPDFENAKQYLEENDGAGNTFKATSKPVLIGTAVVGATTMIFSLILVIKEVLHIEPELILNLLNPYTLLGLLAGGAVIYWFSGASMQAVTTGSYRAVEYIKDHIKLDDEGTKTANVENSKEVVKICTQYAQKGMVNIFISLFAFALAFACLSAPASGNNVPVSFFVSYLVAIAVFGLFQAVFMANAGGCWDNAKKIVEVDLKEKGTPLHDATVVGDTVGDPFKDTSSVAMNPIIKFTTLFGLLAMEIAISESFRDIAPVVGWVFLVIALVFVYRSFYAMRIPKKV